MEELAARGAGELFGVDVVDIRREKSRPFRLFDGVDLPFIDRRFDVVVLSFVLHHVPNERKRALLREALRVCRGTVVIVEDTPVDAARSADEPAPRRELPAADQEHRRRTAS